MGKGFSQQKKALFLQDFHSYMECREALDRGARKQLVCSLCVMIPLGLSHIGTYLGYLNQKGSLQKKKKKKKS